MRMNWSSFLYFLLGVELSLAFALRRDSFSCRYSFLLSLSIWSRRGFSLKFDIFYTMSSAIDLLSSSEMALMFREALGANNLFRFLFSVSFTFLLILSTLSAFFTISFFIFLSRNTPIISESPFELELMMEDFTCSLGTNLLDTSYLSVLDEVDLLDFWCSSFSL